MIDPNSLTQVLIGGLLAIQLWVLQQVYSLNGRVSRIEGHLGVKRK
jgi:hypothetical protein